MHFYLLKVREVMNRERKTENIFTHPPPQSSSFYSTMQILTWNTLYSIRMCTSMSKSRIRIILIHIPHVTKFAWVAFDIQFDEFGFLFSFAMVVLRTKFSIGSVSIRILWKLVENFFILFVFPLKLNSYWFDNHMVRNRCSNSMSRLLEGAVASVNEIFWFS